MKRINIEAIENLVREGKYKLVQHTMGRKSGKGCLIAAHFKANGIRMKRDNPLIQLIDMGFRKPYLYGIMNGFDNRLNYGPFYPEADQLEYKAGYETGMEGLKFLMSLKKK